MTYDGGRWTIEEQIDVDRHETWTNTTMHENHPNGTEHEIRVRVWDGVGNPSNWTTIPFLYIKPPSPFTLSPGEGYAALDTWVVDSGTGLVESQQVTYKHKTLGTVVTANGLSFGSNLNVNITAYIPTYHDYYTSQGTYDILVKQTETENDGSFTTTFVFPEAPAGLYNVTAKSAKMECAVRFEVLPEIIFNPDEVVGPALIDVKATGFTRNGTDPDTGMPSWFFILPDALQGANVQADRWWYIDGNGTLVNSLNDYTECPQRINTTLNWPFMQPGTYTVEIKHIHGDYWDGSINTWIHKPCFVGSNTITVEETLTEIVESAEEAKTAAEEAESAAEDAEATAEEAKTAAEDAASKAEDAKTAADNATAAAEEAATKADNAKTAADNAKTAADSAAAEVEDLADDIAALAGLTMPVYLAVILSLIAAIAAAASGILVYRKIA